MTQAQMDGMYAVLCDADSASDAEVWLACGGCGRVAEDVWPCPGCKQQLHPGCGRGLTYRRLGWPRRLACLRGEVVTGEWVCDGCGTIAGLDTAPAGPAAPVGAYCAGGAAAGVGLAAVTALPATAQDWPQHPGGQRPPVTGAAQ